ncbi:MAG: hypothetical protein WC136_01225 [Sphaerochaeta sp.]
MKQNKIDRLKRELYFKQIIFEKYGIKCTFDPDQKLVNYPYFFIYNGKKYVEKSQILNHIRNTTGKLYDDELNNLLNIFRNNSQPKLLEETDEFLIYELLDTKHLIALSYKNITKPILDLILSYLKQLSRLDLNGWWPQMNLWNFYYDPNINKIYFINICHWNISNPKYYLYDVIEHINKPDDFIIFDLGQIAGNAYNYLPIHSHKKIRRYR